MFKIAVSSTLERAVLAISPLLVVNVFVNSIEGEVAVVLLKVSFTDVGITACI